MARPDEYEDGEHVMMVQRLRCRAFTLVEVATSLAIVMVLSSIAAPVYLGMLANARVDAARQGMEAIKSAIMGYGHDTGQISESLTALASDPGVAGWRGPYLAPATDPSLPRSTLPVDPWGRTFRWVVSSGRRGVLRCTGPDGVEQALAGDDLILGIDLTAVLRQQMLNELELINEAVRRYNDIHLPEAPLPTTITALITLLVDQGYLIGSVSALSTDPFSRDYVVDSTSVCRVRCAGL